jgi:hypothetical protein
MDITRRDLLRTGVAACATLSAGSFTTPGTLQAQGKRGGILRVRGYDPPHFDPHLAFNPKLRYGIGKHANQAADTGRGDIQIIPKYPIGTDPKVMERLIKDEIERRYGPEVAAQLRARDAS